MANCSGSVIGGRASGGAVRATTGGRGAGAGARGPGGPGAGLGVRGSGGEGGLGRGLVRGVVDRPGREQILRERLPAGAAAGRGLFFLVLLVVVVVVVVVVAAQQPVGELPQPLRDLVHRCRGDDEEPEERQEGQQDDGDDRPDAGTERGTDGPSDQSAGPGDTRLGDGRGTEDLRDAEDGGDRAQPADRQPAARLGPGSAAQEAQRGEEQDDRQHHDQRSDDPAHALGQTDADRPDPVAPGGGAQHDRQAQDGETDAVPAVLGGQRFGLLRAGDRPRDPARAAGEQVPTAGDHPPETGRTLLLGSRTTAGGGGTLGRRALLARSRRTGAGAG